MVAGGMRRIPAALGWLILAFLRGAAYIGNILRHRRKPR
jgi:hypothetical protein